MRIGIHTSSSGALERAAAKAYELGANCFQIFSSSPRMWAAPPPDPLAIQRLEAMRKKLDLTPLVIHANYLINLCSIDAVIRPKSIAAFRAEIEAAIAIGAEYLVVHPGSAKDQSCETAIVAFAEGLAEAAGGLQGPRLQILLENTAGQGASLGGKLHQLAAIRELAQPKVGMPIAYCLDTCHCFAAGYEVHTEKGLKAFLKEAEEVLGLDAVPVIHTNDSKGTLGSHLDRHANIGEGYIGLEGFRRILQSRVLRRKAFILETPVDSEGDDRKNVEALLSLSKR